MNDIAQKNNIQIGYYNREKILRIFRLIDQNSPQVNIGRKRMISVNFILKQLFDILEKKHKVIPLTKSKTMLNYYSEWWRILIRVSSGGREEFLPISFFKFCY